MKWELKRATVCALAALYMSTVMNLAFWRFMLEHLQIEGIHSLLFALSWPVAFILVSFIAFNLILWPYVGKPILALLFIASAGANYFMFTLNVYIDSEMVRNVFATNLNEAAETVTLSGILWVLGLGVLPAVLLFMTRIRYRPLLKEIGSRALLIGICLILTIGAGAAFYKEYSIFARNNKVMGKLLSPTNYITSVARYINKTRLANREYLVIDEHAKLMPYEDAHLTLLVLMIGETARAMNFSLNGYGRETNPELAKQDVISFRNVASAGTATAFSLPCMFSGIPRANFNIDAAVNRENLVDIIQKAGYDVLWLDNDSGSKGVSDRVPTIDLMRTGNPKYRNGDSCYDEVLLDGLEERIGKIEKDTLIVLHMMGSHGPSYYRRYPGAFKVFTPTCDTAEVQGCPRENIVNTYDNTIVYSDHVISGVIDILKRFPQLEAGMLYVSDHGESLGENGVYLHGFPYALAPKEQTQVPMILWMSEVMKRSDHVDYEKLRAADAMPLSHDYLFHSILGLLEVHSELYNSDLDFFRDFRTEKLPFD